MLDTGVIYLDVAIGVAVAFFLLSLVPSGINEAVAFVTRVRSKFLWAYLNQLFTRPHVETGDDAGATGRTQGGAVPAADSAAAKARRYVPSTTPPLAPDATSNRDARAATARRVGGGRPPAVVARSAVETVADRRRAREATERMPRSVGAPPRGSIGLPSTSWEMLGLMRASGARDPRPTLGGGVLADQRRWGPLAGRRAARVDEPATATLPVVAELHRRLGPIAVAANAGVATGAKAEKPTTTKHVPPRSLALALVDLLAGSGATDAQVAATLDGLAGTPIHSTLVSLWTARREPRGLR